MSSNPERTRLNADELTAADADAVLAFLKPRLRAQMDEHYGTPSYRTAFALEGIIRKAAFGVGHHSRKLAEDDFFDSRQKLNSLFTLRDAWNLLWQAVFPWKEEEGYDHARWVHVEYITAQDADKGEALKAEIDAEMRAEETGR